MSLCLLSRGLQNFSLSKFGYCFRLTKVMNALLLDSILLQSPSSTSQPGRQESLLGRGSSLPVSVAEQSTTQSATRLLACKGALANGRASASEHTLIDDTCMYHTR